MMTKNKKIVISFFIFILIVFGIILIKPGLLYWGREIMNPNSLKVETVGDIDKNKVKVIWLCSSKRKVIFENGKDQKKHYKEYGKNHFQILYENELIGEFGQFKYNNWHGHKYLIELKRDSINEIQFKVEVIGPDKERVWTNKEHAIL